MDTFERLRNAAELTENDRAILTYVLDHPEEVASLSTRELAERTHTSASAVSRCCQRLGFSSFAVFKANVASDLKAADPGNLEIDPCERAVSAIAKTASLYEQVTADMRQATSAEEMQRVASLIEGASYTSVLALGSNVISARYLEKNLLLAGYVAKVLDDTESISRFSLVAPRSTVAILISRGGVSSPITVAAQNLARRGVATVALTVDASSPLAKTCDHVLCGFSSLQGNLTYAAWNLSASFGIDTLTAILYSKNIAANTNVNEEHYAQYVDKISSASAINPESSHLVGGVDDMWMQNGQASS